MYIDYSADRNVTNLSDMGEKRHNKTVSTGLLCIILR